MVDHLFTEHARARGGMLADRLPAGFPRQGGVVERAPTNAAAPPVATGLSAATSLPVPVSARLTFPRFTQLRGTRERSATSASTQQARRNGMLTGYGLPPKTIRRIQRDDHGQRPSRNATGIPERKHPDRRLVGSSRASMALDAPVHGAQDVRSWLESGTDMT